uniref:Uncharacterized protein n=1 Tax=Oryza sativa subsp. japonica TaxID=39947 RepID=Q84TY0_ORYSJ|nr:hypothetical protein [Oryza sativa Japonica Group]
MGPIWQRQVGRRPAGRGRRGGAAADGGGGGSMGGGEGGAWGGPTARLPRRRCGAPSWLRERLSTMRNGTARHRAGGERGGGRRRATLVPAGWRDGG